MAMQRNAYEELKVIHTEVQTEDELEFIKAAEKGNLKRIKALHEQGVNLNVYQHIKTSKASTPGFHKAKRVEFNETALSAALKAGHDEVAQYLLEQGAEIEQTYPFNCIRPYFPSLHLYLTTAFRHRVHTDNLLGLACYSRINSDTFRMLLRHAD